MQLISEHFPAADFTVFLGDMNYRVDLDSAQVRKLAASGMYGDILAHCQMQKAMQLQDSPFSGFSEAPITFAPSYSYDVGTDNFDSSPKNRIPSYCDRILWRASSRGSLAISCNCSSYHMSPLNASDHKPVVALLQLSMTHDTANSRSSIAAAPIAPMNIGAHSRMRFVSSGPLLASHNKPPTTKACEIRLRHRQAASHACKGVRETVRLSVRPQRHAAPPVLPSARRRVAGQPDPISRGQASGRPLGVG